MSSARRKGMFWKVDSYLEWKYQQRCTDILGADIPKEENTYSFGAIGEWEIYLNTGAVNKILDEIDHYFSEKKRHHGLTAYELKAMQVNLIQMVNTVLMKNNIEAHELFVNTEYETYRKMSLKNYDNYMEFCKYLLQKHIAILPT